MILLDIFNYLHIFFIKNIKMPKIISIFFLFCFLDGSYVPHLKNIAHLSNVKNNVFTGYGIVVGLSGTGDRKNPLTQKSLENFLKKQDLKIEKNKFNTRNSAMVSVVAKTFGFLWKGDSIDITVASLGDAQKIDNGFLLPTSLKASDGEKYILASGFIKTASNSPTLGIISSGGIIEKNLSKENIHQTKPLSTSLSFIINDGNSHYLTAIKKKIEETFPSIKVTIQDNKRFLIKKNISNRFTQDEIIKILDLKINIPPKEKIIIDKQTGVVIIGGNISINPSHISFPYTSINITSSISQRKGNKYATINDLVQELNAMNVTTNEIISIFTGLKRSGAFNADLIFQ